LAGKENCPSDPRGQIARGPRTGKKKKGMEYWDCKRGKGEGVQNQNLWTSGHHSQEPVQKRARENVGGEVLPEKKKKNHRGGEKNGSKRKKVSAVAVHPGWGPNGLLNDSQKAEGCEEKPSKFRPVPEPGKKGVGPFCRETLKNAFGVKGATHGGAGKGKKWRLGQTGMPGEKNKRKSDLGVKKTEGGAKQKKCAAKQACSQGGEKNESFTPVF